MTFNKGKCEICNKEKIVGLMECTEMYVCLECFNLVQENLPEATYLINSIVKPQIEQAIKIINRHLN